MSEQPSPTDAQTCSWKRGGDFCLHPVERAGELCPHHTKLWAQLKEQEQKKQREPPKVPEEIPWEETAATGSDGEPRRRTGKRPSKYERQKRVIRQGAWALLESGREGGLSPDQVGTLIEMLDVLGFLQSDQAL